MTGVRHRVRMAALQIVFEVDITDHTLEEVVDRHLHLQEEPLSPDAQQFLRSLVHGVWEHRSYLDNTIQTAAPTWPVEQMPGVDKAILRIALFELLFAQNQRTPTKAIINEAVELAKYFGSDNSSRFVNGVLGTVVKQQT